MPGPAAVALIPVKLSKKEKREQRGREEEGQREEGEESQGCR